MKGGGAVVSDYTELIAALRHCPVGDCVDCKYRDCCEKLAIDAADAIEELQAERARGKWERHFLRPCVYADMFWHCSVCGYKNAESFANVYHNYCPNCGEKMEVE